MKTILFAFIAAILSAQPALADDKVQTIPPFPQSCCASPYGDICLHAFGGHKTRIDLLDTTEGMCGGEVLQLSQLSNRLTAPIGEPITLRDSHCDAVVIMLPEVKEKTIFRLSIVKDGGDTVLLDGKRMLLIAVYHADLWAPLREWSRNNHLIVNDRTGNLTRLLDAQHIHYSPIKLPIDKSMQEICLWVEAVDSDPPFACASMLVLHEAAEELPYIAIQKSPGERRADVYMPLLDALQAHPLAQENFIHLIQSLSQGEQP